MFGALACIAVALLVGPFAVIAWDQRAGRRAFRNLPRPSKDATRYNTPGAAP